MTYPYFGTLPYSTKGSAPVFVGYAFPNPTQLVAADGLANMAPWAAASPANIIPTQIGGNVYGCVGVAGTHLALSTPLLAVDNFWGLQIQLAQPQAASNVGLLSFALNGGLITLSGTITAISFNGTTIAL